MRTYDPADRICYVHLGQGPAAPAVPPPARDECHRLPAGYANASLRADLARPRATDARPALVLLPGGSARTDAAALAAPALLLVQ